MGKKKTILYALLLTGLLLTGALLGSTGRAQARYVNQDIWYTALSVSPDARITSNCLVGGGQTVLLGNMELQERLIPFALNSTHTVPCTVDWEIPQDQAEYLQAGMLLNGDPVTKNVTVELPAGENMADLQLIPTQMALETVHDQIDVTVQVRWTTGTQTLSADFRVTLPAVTALPELPEDTQPPEEETQPEETQTPSETEPSVEEPTEDPQTPEMITETEPATEPEETTAPTEPEETTAPTEPEETTAPTEPEETTAPTEPEETTAPTEPEETTTPTEPEETTAPTEPEETTTPTEPEETTPPTQPDVEPVSPVQLRSLAHFSREYYLPAVIDHPQGTDRVVLSARNDAKETMPLPPFTRYSTDGGTEWYLLYYGGSPELTPQTATQTSVLLDFSCVEETWDTLTLYTQAYAGESCIGSVEHICAASSESAVSAASEPWILREKEHLTLRLNPDWSACTLEYTLQMLTEDKTTGELVYIPVELSEEGLSAQHNGDTLVFRLGKEKCGAGAYRITFTWKFEELCFAVKQTSFFINYSSD